MAARERSDRMNDSKFGSIEATHNLWLFFNKELDVFKKVRQISLNEDNGLWSVLIPLIYAIEDSSESLSLLANKGKTRDCFVIARVIFETIVNACFICAQGEEAANKVRRHSLQKSYRDLDRELEINARKLTLHWTGTVDPSQDPELQASIKEFTAKSGREITSWTPESVKEKIEQISQKYGPRVVYGLQFGLFAIYRHASEIVHGTLFGALFILGLTAPKAPQSQEELAYQQRGQLSMILMMLGLSLSSMILVLSEHIVLGELVDESEALVDSLKAESWAKDAFSSQQP